jgi:pimeloyl-ACP methyl ester carboxylesterase
MQHHFFPLESGQQLHYTAWGKPTAQPLVCVHGLTRNARDFDFLAHQLSADYYVLCVDVLGRGQSSWASDGEQYTVINYAQQMHALLNGLKLVKPHWVGTSMGGLIGLMLQLIAPQRLGKLVLNDVGPVIETAALQRIAQYIGAAPQFASRALAMVYAKQVFGSFGASTDAQWAGLTDHYYLDQADGSVRVHYDPAIAIATKAQVAGTNPEALTAAQAALWGSLKSLQAPVLVLRGETSDLLTPSTVQAMQAINPLVQAATIPNCGHAPHLMDSAQSTLIHSFLSSTP